MSDREKIARAIIAALAAFICAPGAAGCGSDAAGIPQFSPCGGDLVAGWTFVAAALRDPSNGCSPAAGEKPIDGFIFFNADGRYSLNAHVGMWKKAPSDACGFSTADGGFHRVERENVCIGALKEEVDMVECDGNAPIIPAQLRGAAEYCVDGDTLLMESSTMLGLRFPAVFQLTRMP